MATVAVVGARESGREGELSRRGCRSTTLDVKARVLLGESGVNKNASQDEIDL